MTKQFHAFHLDSVNECLWSAGKRVPLTRKTYLVLAYLVARPDRLVTKNELLDAVWPGTYVQEEILKSYVRKLRRILGDSAERPTFIETQTGRGYRFIAPVTDVAATGARRAAGAAATRLFGRDTELGRLRAWHEQALNSERQVVFISGDPGIGKTALIDAFLQETTAHEPQAARPYVATGQCIERHHVQEPYYPILDAITRLATTAPGPLLADLLFQHAPTWLAQIPSLLTTAHRDALQREILGATRDRMLRELCGLLDALAAVRPVVLVLEDLHWADHATLDAIAAIARRHEAARLLVLATYRPVEVILTEHPLKQLKHELLIQRHCQDLPLDLLPAVAVAEYLAARFPDNRFPDDLGPVLYEQTDGNPLFMVTATEHLVAQGLLGTSAGSSTWHLCGSLEQVRTCVPAGVQQTIERQIERLPAEEQAVLQGASIAGMTFSVAVVATAMERELDAVEACTRRLAARRHLLREVGLDEWPDGSVSTRYEFVHSLYGEVLYRTCPAADRVRLHRRVAEAMETRWAAHLEDVAVDLARHSREGRDYPRAVRYLQVAAATAARRQAHGTAVAILESAQRLLTKLPPATRDAGEIAVREQLAGVRDATGDRDAAAALYRDLAECAAHAGRHDHEARALLNLGHQVRMSDIRAALPLYERAAGLAKPFGDLLLATEAEANACFIRLAAFGWRRDWYDTLTQGVDALLAMGALESFALNARVAAFAHMVCGNYAAGARVAAQAKAVAIDVGASASYLYCCSHHGWASENLGRLGESLASLREAIQLAERLGDRLFVAYGRTVLADVHAEAFDFASAQRMCDDVLQANAESKYVHALQMTLVTGATAALGLGTPERVLAHTARIEALYAHGDVAFRWHWEMPLRAAACAAWLACRDLTAARRQAEQLQALSERTADRSWQARAHALQARVALAAADRRTAARAVEAALACLDGYTAPLAAWRVYDTAAAVAATQRRPVQAAHYRQLRTDILVSLADSLADGEPLRQSILDVIRSRR